MTTTHITPDQNLRALRYMGNEITIHVDGSDTNGECAVLEVHAFPGSEPPLHFHENEHELFIIMEGRIRLTCGGVERILSAGESALVKRGTPHTFKILSDSMRSFAILTPAGFENFFRAMASDAPPSFERLAQVAAQYGSHFVTN